LAQEGTDVEIVVVDDGSSDGGPALVQAYDDPRIRLLRQANAGVSAARNRGIAAAQGKWVAFLDADDEYLPGFLQKIQECSARFPAAGAAYSKYAVSSSPARPATPAAGPATPILLQDPISFWYKECSMCSSCVAIRADVLARSGGFPVGVKVGEDLDMWFRVAWSTPIAYVPQVLAVYYLNAGASNWQTVWLRGDELYCQQTFAQWLAENRVPAHLVGPTRTHFQVLRLLHCLQQATHGDPRQARRMLLQKVHCREAPWRLLLGVAACVFWLQGLHWVVLGLGKLLRPRPPGVEPR
jgi:hypothetical protein